MSSSKISQEQQKFKKSIHIVGVAFFFVLASITTYGLLAYQLYELSKTPEDYAGAVLQLPIAIYLIVGISLMTLALIIGGIATSYNSKRGVAGNVVILLVGWIIAGLLTIGVWYLYYENFILPSAQNIT